jgi:hypothetical protein
MIRQRVFGVAAEYEDLNDHEALRADQALQTATSEDETLAGKSTLCRILALELDIAIFNNFLDCSYIARLVDGSSFRICYSATLLC